MILRNMGRQAEELKLLEDVMEHYRRHGSYARESNCQMAMGVCLYHLGRLSESAGIFAQLIDRAPPYCLETTSASARFWPIWIESTRGDLASARAHLNDYVAFCAKRGFDTSNLAELHFEALLAAQTGDIDAAMATLDAAMAARPESLDTHIRPAISKLTTHTLYLCGEHDRVLEIVAREVSSRQPGVEPQRELFWCVFGAYVKFSRGTLEPSELAALLALRGHDRISDAKLGLLDARIALERGDIMRGREALDWAGELCEREGLIFELMAMWRLEAMAARSSGEDDDFARAELAALESSAPPGLPEIAWWPPAPHTGD